MALQRQRAGQWQSVSLPAGEWAVDVVEVDALPDAATFDLANAAQRNLLRKRWRRHTTRRHPPHGVSRCGSWRQGKATEIQTLLPDLYAVASDAERLAALYAVHSALTPQALREWTQQAQALSPALAEDPALLNLMILAYAQLRDLPATESNAKVLFANLADNLGMRAALALNAFRQHDHARAEAWLTKVEALAARIAPTGLMPRMRRYCAVLSTPLGTTGWNGCSGRRTRVFACSIPIVRRMAARPSTRTSSPSARRLAI